MHTGEQSRSTHPSAKVPKVLRTATVARRWPNGPMDYGLDLERRKGFRITRYETI